MTADEELKVEIKQELGLHDKKEKWGSKAEFFLASLGYSVGMGSLTRFPYLAARNGGGAFLIPFTIAMILVGIPLFYMESILGQFSGRSPLSLWVISPAFKGIGYSMTVSSSSLLSFKLKKQFQSFLVIDTFCYWLLYALHLVSSLRKCFLFIPSSFQEKDQHSSKLHYVAC